MRNIPSIPNEEYKERVIKVQAAMKQEGFDLSRRPSGLREDND